MIDERRTCRPTGEVRTIANRELHARFILVEAVVEIVGCTWEFKFQCPRHWNGLRPTDDPNVRICESCLKSVYLCNDDAEVTRRASEGQCVAIGILRDGGAQLLGRVMPVK